MVRQPWLVGPRYDLFFFIGIGIPLCLLGTWAHGIGAVSAQALYMFAANLLGACHVYSTWTITHMEQNARERFGILWIGLAFLVLSVILSPFYFGLLMSLFVYWGLYHMAKQHFGFMMLYRAKAGERDRQDQSWDKYTIYLGLLYPVVVILTRGPHEFSGAPILSPPIPAIVATVMGWLYLTVLGVYIVRAALRWGGGHQPNWPKLLLMGSALLSYYVAFAVINRDVVLSYLVANVFHSVQYTALVWFYNRNRVERGVATGLITHLSRNWKWYLLAMVGGAGLQLGLTFLSLQLQTAIPFGIVMGLQFHHYLLDGKIWSRTHNPELAANLRLLHQSA